MEIVLGISNHFFHRDWRIDCDHPVSSWLKQVGVDSTRLVVVCLFKSASAQSGSIRDHPSGASLVLR